jgi:hypothetical protein
MAKPKGFGNQSQSKKDKGKFSVEMVRLLDDSCCEFIVTNGLAGLSEPVKFHAYIKGTFLRVSAIIPKKMRSELEWVLVNLDEICQLVCNYLKPVIQNVVIRKDKMYLHMKETGNTPETLWRVSRCSL